MTFLTQHLTQIWVETTQHFLECESRGAHLSVPECSRCVRFLYITEYFMGPRFKTVTNIWTHYFVFIFFHWIVFISP